VTYGGSKFDLMIVDLLEHLPVPNVSSSHIVVVEYNCRWFLDWVPVKKTTLGRLNGCQTFHLSVIIKLIDKSQ
jgi:hypothetical protein